MLISIEGNIGSGKSTIINYLKSLNIDNIIFVDEPVNEWINIKINNKNALELFYEDQQNNSFWFQILAYITRLKSLLKTIKNNKDKIIICERSIYTDKYVFAKMLYEMGYLNDMEWITYNYWFDTFKEETKLDLILYINTDAEESYKRINIRNRSAEINTISLEYLQKCHEKHQIWLNDSTTEIIEIDGHQNIENIKKLVNNFLLKISIFKN
jgi:deoxyadenosine/deoxycytidine kinase